MSRVPKSIARPLYYRYIDADLPLRPVFEEDTVLPYSVAEIDVATELTTIEGTANYVVRRATGQYRNVVWAVRASVEGDARKTERRKRDMPGVPGALAAPLFYVLPCAYGKPVPIYTANIEDYKYQDIITDLTYMADGESRVVTTFGMEIHADRHIYRWATRDILLLEGSFSDAALAYYSYESAVAGRIDRIRCLLEGLRVRGRASFAPARGGGLVHRAYLVLERIKEGKLVEGERAVWLSRCRASTQCERVDNAPITCIECMSQ